jgi:hypothetical protein
MKKVFETVGSVVKEEILKSVDHYILKNSFVLENLEPYPGYHGMNLPIDKSPDTFFLITENEYSMEKIFRISYIIRNSMNIYFDACPAKICIGNDLYHSIRVRDLNRYEPVEEIQKRFLDYDIKFHKFKEVESVALIELRKIFNIEELNDHIFKDVSGQLYYLQINEQLKWSSFKDLTQWVKNNMVNNNFDAALAVVYAKDVYDFIRIFENDITIEKLEIIRNKYLEGIKNY